MDLYFSPYRFLTIAPQFNSAGKSDATGVFQPEQERFCERYPGSKILRFNNRVSFEARRRQVLSMIDEEERLGNSYHGLADFSHGLAKSIQAGFASPAARLLVERFKTIWIPAPSYMSIGPTLDAFFLFFACSTAAGIGRDGGFCDEIRDAACRAGMTRVRVAGHNDSGHATESPNLVFVDGEGASKGGAGGRWVIQPRGSLWGPWTIGMRASGTPLFESGFRFWAPVQPVSEIISVLDHYRP